jgi:hypothetical protein
MRGGEEHAVAARFGCFVMFKAFIANPFCDVRLRDLEETLQMLPTARPIEANTPSMVRLRHAASESG